MISSLSRSRDSPSGEEFVNGLIEAGAFDRRASPWQTPVIREEAVALSKKGKSMRCAKCGRTNSPTNNFCAKCGNALAKQCTKCQAENPPTSDFCGKCGASLAEPAAPPLAAPAELASAAPVPATTGERRHLTVLFCDLVGSTPLSQQLDAEEWREVIAKYQQAASGAVARFGGYVAKNLGDGLLIYFGWPTAREDDPAASGSSRACDRGRDGTTQRHPRRR